uniref:Si:dkey-246i14.3 n=1 Tax=Stegastes partitus TaxID=144197 RepID=A0A3B5AQQ5_9TELE
SHSSTEKIAFLMALWNTCPSVFLRSFSVRLCLITASPPPSVMLTAGDLSVQLNLNDYLDIYCPHYPNKGTGQPETLALYLVAEQAFQGCVETRGAIKRWECNTPYAPFGPVRFSEKIQRFTPFSLGFEFLPGRHYYYSCEYKTCVFLCYKYVAIIFTDSEEKCDRSKKNKYIFKNAEQKRSDMNPITT